MRPFTRYSVGALLACAVVALSLAACGGGGSKTGGTDAFVADVPQDPALPSDPNAPSPAPAPGPGLPGDVPDAPPVPPDAPDLPPDEPPRPIDTRQPEPPAPLATWAEFPGIEALALDPVQGVLYAISGETGEIFTMAKDGSGERRLVAQLEMHGIRGLAFDGSASVLHAVRDMGPGEDDRLLRIDPAQFGPEPRPYVPFDEGSIVGYQGVESLAYDDTAHRLYAVDTNADLLLAVEPGGGDVTVVGELGSYGDVVGLAMDHEARRLLGTDATAHALVAIDLETGAATLRARLGDRAIRALASGPDSFLLYGATLEPAEVFAFDALGERWPFAGIQGLAFDPADGLVFGVHTETGVIVKIDRELDQRSYVGFVRKGGLEGLALDPAARTLYALSRSNQQIYALSPDDAALQAEVTVHGAAAPFLGLSALAYGDGVLYASDSSTGNLLRIEPTTGNAFVLGAPNGYPQIEGLAFDPIHQVLHAFCNDQRAYVLVRPKDANAAVLVVRGEFGGIGGLAWAADDRVVLGTDLVEDALVEVSPPREPPTLGYESLSALAYQPEENRLLAFDRATSTLLAIEPELEVGIPLATFASVAVEGMTFDRPGGRLLAVDAEAGTLYALEPGGGAIRIGGEGALAPHRVKAIAFDAVREILYGVDVDADVLLVLDAGAGGARVVNPGGPGLSHGAIEALVHDDARGVLLGLDAATRSLVEIDVEQGTSTPIAEVEVDAVGGMAMLPLSHIVWLAGGDDLRPVDRFDGSLLDPGMDLGLLPSETERSPVQLLWPQGDVRKDALDTCAVEVGAGYEGALDLELRCQGRTLHRSRLTPQGALARFEIPAAVRAQLEAGAAITWNVGDVSASFRVVDGDAARDDIQRVLAHPTVASRSAWERRLVEACVLDRAGLHTEALVVGIGTYEAYPDRPTSARALLRTLRLLGLVETRLGREVSLQALRP